MSEHPRAGGVARPAASLRVAPGLCADCRFSREVASRRTVYVRCVRSDEDARFDRYPALPVRRCGGFEPREDVGLLGKSG